MEAPYGYTNLVLKFNTHDIVAALVKVNDSELFKLNQTGVLAKVFVRKQIEGSDYVIIIGKDR
jgi:hypothetical protein